MNITNSPLRFGEIRIIDFKTDKSFYAAPLRCDGGITNTKERIQHRSDTRGSVQFNAPLGELNWKCRRMRPFLLTTLNCFIRYEPCVPATPQIIPASMRPTRNVALVLIRHPKRQPIQLDPTGLSKMKNIFMAVIQKSRRIDRLKMAE